LPQPQGSVCPHPRFSAPNSSEKHGRTHAQYHSAFQVQSLACRNRRNRVGIAAGMYVSPSVISGSVECVYLEEQRLLLPKTDGQALLSDRYDFAEQTVGTTSRRTNRTILFKKIIDGLNDAAKDNHEMQQKQGLVVWDRPHPSGRDPDQQAAPRLSGHRFAKARTNIYGTNPLIRMECPTHRNSPETPARMAVRVATLKFSHNRIVTGRLKYDRNG
jgi:hypothetical protein